MVRHRTANINEYSTRYSEAIDDKQQTKPDEWRSQAKTNKQGSGEFLPLNSGTHEEMDGNYLTMQEGRFQKEAAYIYG